MFRRFEQFGRQTSLAALSLAIGLSGCSDQEQTLDEADDLTVPQVPMPAADGPQLFVLRGGTIVRDRPSPSGKVLGTLRAGAQVARAADAYSKRKCAGGWYPIRPRGFVCAGGDASLEDNNPIAKLLRQGPAMDRALPYRYARVNRSAGVLYHGVPSADEQQLAEPKRKPRRTTPARPLGLAANDVPLSEDYLPTGLPFVAPGNDGVGNDGRRSVASFFNFTKATGNPSLASGLRLLPPSAHNQTSRVLKRKSGLAVVASIRVGSGQSARAFGLTADGSLVGLDRLRPMLGSTRHGYSIAKGKLPVGFALGRRGLTGYALSPGKFSRTDDELEPGQVIPLSGTFRTVNRVRFFKTIEGSWVRHRDIIMAPRRNKFPEFAQPGQKWLDISLANQTLVAYEGKKALFATLISSGQQRLGDPAKGEPATKQGVFKVRRKAVSMALDPRETQQAFSIAHAPWVLEFEEGFAITGSYWQSQFGEAQNFHNITLAPVDAHWLWHWAGPELPQGWHSIQATKGSDTVVYVHR